MFFYVLVTVYVSNQCCAICMRVEVGPRCVEVSNMTCKNPVMVKVGSFTIFCVVNCLGEKIGSLASRRAFAAVTFIMGRGKMGQHSSLETVTSSSDLNRQRRRVVAKRRKGVMQGIFNVQ